MSKLTFFSGFLNHSFVKPASRDELLSTLKFHNPFKTSISLLSVSRGNKLELYRSWYKSATNTVTYREDITIFCIYLLVF